MNLRICCDAFITLNDFVLPENVEANIEEYSLNNTSLTGNVSITGNYQKTSNTNSGLVSNKFRELVPFTVVFKNPNYKINDLGIDNFRYYEVVNQGLECSFEIVAQYDIDTPEKEVHLIVNKEVTDIDKNKNLDKDKNSDKNKKIEENENSIELETEIDNNNININNINNKNDIDDKPQKNNNELNNELNNIEMKNMEIQDIDIDSSEAYVNDEETISEIKEKYDILLKNIFTSRDEQEPDNINVISNNDEFSDAKKDDEYLIVGNKINNEENKEIIKESINETTFEEDSSNDQSLLKGKALEVKQEKLAEIVKPKGESSKVSLKGIKEAMSTYRVYFPVEEKEIDKICSQENVSAFDIYNDSSNKDFASKRRIIIKK